MFKRKRSEYEEKTQINSSKESNGESNQAHSSSNKKQKIEQPTTLMQSNKEEVIRDVLPGFRYTENTIPPQAVGDQTINAGIIAKAFEIQKNRYAKYVLKKPEELTIGQFLALSGVREAQGYQQTLHAQNLMKDLKAYKSSNIKLPNVGLYEGVGKNTQTAKEIEANLEKLDAKLLKQYHQFATSYKQEHDKTKHVLAVPYEVLAEKIRSKLKIKK